MPQCSHMNYVTIIAYIHMYMAIVMNTPKLCVMQEYRPPIMGSHDGELSILLFTGNG